MKKSKNLYIISGLITVVLFIKHWISSGEVSAFVLSLNDVYEAILLFFVVLFYLWGRFFEEKEK